MQRIGIHTSLIIFYIMAIILSSCEQPVSPELIVMVDEPIEIEEPAPEPQEERQEEKPEPEPAVEIEPEVIPEPEPEEEPAELEEVYDPGYDQTLYSMIGQTTGWPSEYLEPSESGIIIGEDEYLYDDLQYHIIDRVRIVQIICQVSTEDSWFFFGDNLQRFFGIDHQNMTLDELEILCDMINRCPDEPVRELLEVYGK